jgi:hypothetical protein
MTSLTHPRKILLVVPQIGKQEIGKANDLSATLCNAPDVSVIQTESVLGSPPEPSTGGNVWN